MKAEKKKKGDDKKGDRPGTELLHVIDSVMKDKGISREVLVEALESALLTAAKKKLGMHRELEARFNEDLGEIELFEFKEVVETVADEFTQVALDQGRALDPEAEVGDSLGVKIDTENFGRIAAQTAKQVIIQKVRDAERLMIYNEYKDRAGEIITGTVRRFEKGNMIVDLGRTEAILPRSEQVPRENYRVGDRIRAHIMQVHQESKGPQLVLSRRSQEFVKKLFAMEVPEVNEGIVVIEDVARDPGVRSKIAVSSRDSDVDPVGACVGMKGSRVQAVVQELRGEKIDIIPWTRDIAKNVCNALAPADVSRMILDDNQLMVLVIVSDDQLSLAIGKKGQNVRLASQLTGWNIDIKGETEMQNLTKEAQETLGRIPGIGPVLAEKLYLEGFTSAYDLSRADPEVLGAIPGIGKVKTMKIMEAASEFFQDQLLAGEVDVRGRSLKKKEPEAAPAVEGEGGEKHEGEPAGQEQGPEAAAPEGEPAGQEQGSQEAAPEGEPAEAQEGEKEG
ncbi:MAG TPA: transcription termination factor NusA [bacterium]|nr:transcription termination factor NusA [bacterium]